MRVVVMLSACMTAAGASTGPEIRPSLAIACASASGAERTFHAGCEWNVTWLPLSHSGRPDSTKAAATSTAGNTHATAGIRIESGSGTAARRPTRAGNGSTHATRQMTGPAPLSLARAACTPGASDTTKNTADDTATARAVTSRVSHGAAAIASQPTRP